MVETWRDIDWDQIDTGYTYGTHADDSGQVKDQLKSALFDEYEKVLQMHHDRVQNAGLEGTIASAATPDIGAKLENILLVTGAVGITGFVTADAGTTRKLVFEGVLTLTDSSSLKLLPSLRENITTAAGDWAVMVSRGSGNWECIQYTRAAGYPVKGSLLIPLTKTGIDFTKADLTADGQWRDLDLSGAPLPGGGTIKDGATHAKIYCRIKNDAAGNQSISFRDKDNTSKFWVVYVAETNEYNALSFDIPLDANKVLEYNLLASGGTYTIDIQVSGYHIGGK